MSAEATIRSAILGAMADTSHETGLRAGAAVDSLLQAIMKSITAPDVLWALTELGAGDKTIVAKGSLF